MYSFQIKLFPFTGLNHKPIIYTEATDLLETKRKTTKCLFGGHYINRLDSYKKAVC